MLTACQHLRRGDCPPDYAAVQGGDPKTIIMRGGSAIVSPLGQVLAGPLFNEDGILIAEIDRYPPTFREGSRTSTWWGAMRGRTSSVFA